MLNFIIGTGGTGKTTEIFSHIGEGIKRKTPMILLVPEQYSFESERRIYQEFGGESSLYIEVLTFTRLCNSIFRKFGGLAGVNVTPTARYLFMSMAVDQVQDQLVVYRPSVRNTGFLETLITACNEFKTAGLTPIALEEFIKVTSEGRLKSKLADLSIIYTGYQAFLDKGYSSPEDDLIRACEILENNNFFENIQVFVDGFTTFMSGEFEFLAHIIAQSPSTTFAMTAPELLDKTRGTGVFSQAQVAIQRLRKTAELNGVKEGESKLLTIPLRYETSDLAYLSQQFLTPDSAPYEAETQGISLYPAQNPYDEISVVASEINRLVRQEGLRYKDFAIITREPSDYFSVLEMVLGRYKVPYFSDQKLDIESAPIVSGLLAALKVVEGGYRLEDMLAYIKSPLLGLTPWQVGELENYSYIWQINKTDWTAAFENHPKGLKKDFSLLDKQLLERINSLRSQLIRPLEKLKQGVTKGSGIQFAKGIYSFLEEIQATVHLLEYGQRLGEEEETLFLQTNNQLWDSILDILDIFGQALGKELFSASRLLELFRLSVYATDIGLLPQTLDQVLVGGADRIRPGALKCVFLVGANEGSFPKPVSGVGVFSQQERESLVEQGLGISGGGMSQSVLERFYAYFAAALPSKYLYVSFSQSTLQGGEGLESSIVSGLVQLFPQVKRLKRKYLDYVEGTPSALSLLSRQMGQDTVLGATLWAHFQNENADILEALSRSSHKSKQQLTEEGISKGIFGENLRLSPSRVERYYSCPYAYFVQAGLGLQKRKKVEFSPLESGSIIHYVLQKVLEKHGGKGLAEKTLKELEQESREYITQYLEGRIQELTLMPNRFQYLFNRLCSTLARLLKHLGKEFSQSAFEPTFFELRLSSNEGVPPLELLTKEGEKVTVEGIIDRVDLMNKGGQTYVRVVDYKSGSKSFRLSDILAGLNLQMLLYLFSIEEKGEGKLAGALPAGVLYMPVRESYFTAQRHTDPKKLAVELEKQWTMSGLVLSQEEALRGMEEDLNGRFIPVTLKKDGQVSAQSSVAGLEEMGLLAKKVKSQVINMAQNLRLGEINNYPIQDIEYPTCEYCDYREICGYEEGDPTKELEKLSNAQLLLRLKEEEDNE